MLKLFNPFKFTVNRVIQGLFVTDMHLEMLIKRYVGRTTTIKYNSNVERTLNFSFFEAMGGVDYVSLFVDIKHVYVTTDAVFGTSDCQISLLFRDINYSYRVLRVLTILTSDEDRADIVYVNIKLSKSNLWKFNPDSVRFAFAIRDNHKGERLSENLPSGAVKQLTSIFEDITGSPIGFT